MQTRKFDEEGLLKDIELSELALKISKLTFGWSNHSDPIKESQRLMDTVRKLALEISEYEQRMGTDLSEYQRIKIYHSMEDVEVLVDFGDRITKSYQNQFSSHFVSRSFSLHRIWDTIRV